jgi:hypothetical protein
VLGVDVPSIRARSRPGWPGDATIEAALRMRAYKVAGLTPSGLLRAARRGKAASFS